MNFDQVLFSAFHGVETEFSTRIGDNFDSPYDGWISLREYCEGKSVYTTEDGVFVNGKKVEWSTSDLFDDDAIKIGDVWFRKFRSSYHINVNLTSEIQGGQLILIDCTTIGERDASTLNVQRVVTVMSPNLCRDTFVLEPGVSKIVLQSLPDELRGPDQESYDGYVFDADKGAISVSYVVLIGDRRLASCRFLIDMKSKTRQDSEDLDIKHRNNIVYGLGEE